MGNFEIHYFPLTKKEKEECRRKKIPYFYWYYLKAVEKGWGIKQIRELIQNRIKNSTFSNEDINIIASGIAGKIRELVNMYHDGKGMDVKELNRIFNTEIFTLFKDFMARKNWRKENNKKRMQKLAKEKVVEELHKASIKNAQPAKETKEVEEKKKAKAKIVKRKLRLFSKADNQQLEPTLYSSGRCAKDRDCLYFDKCFSFAKEHNSCLDCSNCPHQNIDN